MDVVKLTKYLSCPSKNTLQLVLESCSDRRIVVEFAYLVAKDLDQCYDKAEYPEVYKTRQTCLELIRQRLENPDSVSRQQLLKATNDAYDAAWNAPACNAGTFNSAAYAAYAAYTATNAAYSIVYATDKDAAANTAKSAISRVSKAATAYSANQATHTVIHAIAVNRNWDTITKTLMTLLKREGLLSELLEELWT